MTPFRGRTAAGEGETVYIGIFRARGMDRMGGLTD